ncbi:hypothetical protein ACFQ3N_01050 [Virgibacillus byunsanensis]|uniref:Uncharacterized protein n=1 Tax=Virgibacillus byunsanensis TaxID=570945 RepID=A0ABW3LJ97_9BACI
MFHYEYELLAKMKRQELEKAAREAWKFSSIKHESLFLKKVKSLKQKFSKRNTQPTEPCCCVTC